MRTTRPARTAPAARTATLTATLTAAVAATLLAASPAVAGPETVLRDTFAGSLPTGPVVAGVAPGGAPWVLDAGSRVRVRADGRITVNLRGLVIPDRGNPVAQVAASLACDGVVVGSTAPFALDPRGNGHTADRITVPAGCDDGVVLIRNAANPAGLGAYFATATA